jgi:hypothetical protein
MFQLKRVRNTDRPTVAGQRHHLADTAGSGARESLRLVPGVGLRILILSRALDNLDTLCRWRPAMRYHLSRGLNDRKYAKVVQHLKPTTTLAFRGNHF